MENQKVQEMPQQPEPSHSNGIVPEVVKDEIVLSRPSVPVTVDDLAALPAEGGLQIVETRRKIVESLRKASISLTSPQDWLLFKAEDRVTAYLQDQGCGRVAALWGIEITPCNGFERTTMTEDPKGDFAYTSTADGFCNATNLFCKGIQGTRYSTEDFCKDLSPLQKEVRVKQASVANRNGNIIRTLTGMKNVAIEEIEAAWKGTGKTTALCPKGRGYGSKHERQGAQVQEGNQTSDPGPKCPKCGAKMNFREAGKTQSGKEYSAFWGCSQYKASGCKGSVQNSDYLKSKPQVQKYGEGADPDPMLDRVPGQEG